MLHNGTGKVKTLILIQARKLFIYWTSCEAIAGDPVEGSQVDNTTEVDDEPLPF